MKAYRYGEMEKSGHEPRLTFLKLHSVYTCACACVCVHEWVNTSDYLYVLCRKMITSLSSVICCECSRQIVRDRTSIR